MIVTAVPNLPIANVITLTLLHPIQSTPVQSWSFEHEPIIRIGRSSDNHVILYSAVVSRHHVELRQVGPKWEVVNLGANGTYLNGKQIAQVPVVDGVVIRLARSGPNVQIHLGTAATLGGEKTLAQRARPKPEPTTEGQVAAGNAAHLPSPPVTSPPDLEDATPEATRRSPADRSTLLEQRSASAKNGAVTVSEMLFDSRTGQPLQVLQTIGNYQLIKLLWQDEVALEQVAWRGRESLLLKTLNAQWAAHLGAQQLFHQQADPLLGLSHAGLPQFVEVFEQAGQPYLVAEWVHGQRLSQHVRDQGVLSPAAAIAAVLQVCAVLEYLHQQVPPVLHQDLKPDHLIQRATNGAIVVTGFVPLHPLKLDRVATGGYAAPEQQHGEAYIASDLFALGPLLVFLLTGKPPKSFYAQREQGFRFYPEYVPGLSATLTDIVRKLTHPKPEERYSDAATVAEALRYADSSSEKL